MDSETLIAGIADPRYDEEAKEAHGAFNPSWQATDAALLLPSNLTIPKVQRAWDRKPLNPFSRQRLRVGKVWKRPTSSLRNAMSEEPVEDNRAIKRRKARNSFQGPLKPVKKMCLSSDFGMAAHVLQWDGAESPVRKIVTRSNASSDDMVALSDEEESDEVDDEGDVTVEILDEDGTVLDVGGEELAEEIAEEQDWEDEVDADREEPFDGTMMHLGDLMMSANVNFGQPDASRVNSPESTSQRFPLDQQAVEPVSTEGHAEPDAEPVDSNSYVEAEFTPFAAPEEPLSPPVPSIQPQIIGLPDGFVSPVKRPFAFGRRSARQSFGSRRRTLPVQFAPFAIADEVVMPIDESTVEAQQAALEADAQNKSELADAIAESVTSSDVQESGMEQDWEDVEDEPFSPQLFDSEQHTADGVDGVDGAASEYSDIPRLEFAAQECESKQPKSVVEKGTQVSVVQQEELHTESKLSSSPIPTIDGQHPRLPLRRSPRRKSSSPLKQSTILPSTEKSHLIAFTPLRAPSQYPSPSNHTDLSNPFLDEEQPHLQTGSPLERAASAPPEEPQMSPQKPSRPRVSDDTALLQAFLNRAAESKSSRRISATQRESITNRRDSDAVRQALASPAKAEVLGDLDPNSPSPRKPSATLDNPSVFDGIELGATTMQEQFDDSKSGPTTRRGDRAARRAQPQTPAAAPNKIAIRGNAENVFIKKSEAQGLANLTRNNTRKNKGGAVLPPIRLTKLLSLTSSFDGDLGAEDANGVSQVEKPPGSRSVKWAETLVEFYQSGEISESSILSDELNPPAQPDQPSKASSDDIAAPPPPSETPSRPKIRRLKPPRTAATPGKPPRTSSAPPAAETEKLAVPEATSKQQAKPTAPTKRQSRIATPAKGLTNASLLPSDLEPEPAIQAPAAEKKIAPKKKSATSKLPAPASASVSSSLGQGKENLISSPPKKRTFPTAKTFAPKLDLSSKTQLQSSAPNSTSDIDTVPGLSSPAKKAKGRGVVFGSMPATDFGVEKKDEVPGLSSPAKKRTRRTGGA